MTRGINLRLISTHCMVVEGFKSFFGKRKLKGVDSLTVADTYSSIKSLSWDDVDVCFIDIHLDGINGLDYLSVAQAKSPKTKFIIYTFFSNYLDIDIALRQGALGFLNRNSSISQINNCIAAVIANTKYLPQDIEQIFAGKNYSIREVEIIHYVAEGLSNAEIASMLGISGGTVHSHLKRLSLKLEANNRTHIIKQAQLNGLLSM